MCRSLDHRENGSWCEVWSELFHKAQHNLELVCIVCAALRGALAIVNRRSKGEVCCYNRPLPVHAIWGPCLGRRCTLLHAAAYGGSTCIAYNILLHAAAAAAVNGTDLKTIHVSTSNEHTYSNKHGEGTQNHCTKYTCTVCIPHTYTRVWIVVRY